MKWNWEGKVAKQGFGIKPRPGEDDFGNNVFQICPNQRQEAWYILIHLHANTVRHWLRTDWGADGVYVYILP